MEIEILDQLMDDWRSLFWIENVLFGSKNYPRDEIARLILCHLAEGNLKMREISKTPSEVLFWEARLVLKNEENWRASGENWQLQTTTRGLDFLV